MAALTMEEYELMKESKYRMYVAAVDKALKNFEYTSEWADLISALGKLNKVLISYTRYPVIPRRIKISKRLAQCMHPALPSGVHLKALETYDIIFKSMGPSRLSSELFIYSSGLFPLMGHAAMNIRPTLLSIYEKHFLPLEDRLKPALGGFLSGILLGLDTGSDHFDRTNLLLERVCEAVGPPYFYTCIWQCVANNSPVRLPAITYVLVHYSKKHPMEDQLHLMGLDVGLMVSGLCAAVQDSSVLVQRSALDLLMVCFPMQNKQLLYSDMVRLVTAALSTILRRDMSLNRRLYSWLLDKESMQLPEVQIEGEADPNLGTPLSIAFDLLNDALKSLLKKSCGEVPIDVRPYRLLTSLFEKPQIGPVILDSILYDIFRSLYLSCLHQQKHKNSSIRCVSFNGDVSSLKPADENLVNKQFVAKNCKNLVKNANLLFNTLQSYYIWSYIERLFEESIKNVKRCKSRDRCVVHEIGSGPPDVLELCILTDFLLDIIPIESYSESTCNILPNLFIKIVKLLKANINDVNHVELSESLKLCTKVLGKIQPAVSVIGEVKENGEGGSEVQEGKEEETRTLEKSKSDSKINENLEKNELTIEEARERSYSNQMLKMKREKTSPKIEKKSKNKKSKSSSKLYDLKKDEEEFQEKEKKEEKEEEEKVVESKPKIENKLLMKCLNEYKSFYVVFVKVKILPGVDIERFFKTLVCEKDHRTGSLEKLLKYRLGFASPAEEEASGGGEEVVVLCSEGGCFEGAMGVASNVLLEFSAFLNCVEGEGKGVPEWLKALVVAGVCSGGSKEVQVTAMGTALEIFSLARDQKFRGCTSAGNGGNNIVIGGILNREHLEYIEESTLVLERMSQILWNMLELASSQSQLILCITLLYQIHNTFDTKSFVEQVIGFDLSQTNLTANYIKRFILLWHLGRDLNIKLPPNKSNIRNFDRSLLKILDNLQNKEKPHLQLLSESFLTHSLVHNDMPRIINPMLAKLLAPNTARVSIKNVNIHDSDTQSECNPQEIGKLEETPAKKIYAVSSINGNIMYHVTDPSPKPTKRRWFAFSKSGKKFSPTIVNTITTVEEDSVVTKKNKDFKSLPISPKLEKAAKNNVKLTINPLSSKEIYPNGIDGSYNKLDSHRSSSDSLSSNELTQNSMDSFVPAFQSDSGYSSYQVKGLNLTKKNLIESIEPISDGIKSEALPKSRSFDEKACNAKESLENSLVHSWSYCVSDCDNINGDLEFSKSAEDFFKGKENEKDVVSEILNYILDQVCLQARPNELDLRRSNCQIKNFSLYPIHSHLCLYCEIFDSNQVFYALQTLKNCVLSCPELFIKCLATSGIKDLKNGDVLNLLARHHKSLQGNGFIGEVPQDLSSLYRGYMFLDVIILICLNYARTFYPFLESSLMQEEVNSNLRIQLESLELLEIVIKNVNNMVEGSSKGFSSYIADLLVKCNLQEVLLHCLLISVRSFDEDMTFAEEVLLFNNFLLQDSNNRVSEAVEAFQIQLLRVISCLIILEHNVFEDQVLIPQNNIFLSAVLSALRHQNLKNLHEKWLNMINSSLPYFGDNLKQISTSVIHQICNNLEEVANSYGKDDLDEEELCADYAVTQLESLTVLCHYCLLDASQTVNQNVPQSSTTAITNPGEIFNNLVNVFFSPLAVESVNSTKQNSDHYQLARKTILSHMPRIISSVAKLWQVVVGVENDYNSVYGNAKTVKQQLLEFLSPISVHHGASFLAAIAVAWFERRNPFSSVKTVLPEPNAGQNNLVYLISAIRVIPLDNLVQTVIAVIKNPPPIEGLNGDICLDVSVLELFYCYMRKASATQLSEAWSSLLALVREGSALTPPAQFLLTALLHELMIKCCPLEERKDQKDLQDVTAKLIESVSQVCGACLEQTTWLRRNLAVKEQGEDATPDSSLVSNGSGDPNWSTHSVQAQLVLAEILAPILDICFGSSEKDKVNAILTNLMYNIVPYLKNHTARNMPSFHACSKLLAGLSSYQYTRKAWKKDVFDLLLDNNLFQMDYSCLKYWRVIVDNLMTHDNTTFRDLMSRVSMTQSGSLSLFSSREQEYEQRAQLLKRLAYVIFCSEMDQYAKYMPDIQEQLTSSLRLNVPGVQAQVFLCFRVLLIRMSPLHVTSLWPIIISEILQVFLHIEHELINETDEFSQYIKLMSSLDASWATNSSNGLHAHGHPHWLKLQLATTKLLDLALLLPAISLPQFQMYRWAFVGDDLERHQTSSKSFFIPHVNRIAELMDKKFTDTQIETLPMKRNELLLTMNSISQLKDLHSFFKTLSLCSNRHRTECSKVVSNDYSFTERPPDKKLDMILEKIDKVIEMDFLDKIPR